MATASAGRADKGLSRGSRAFRAPLRRDRLAVCGQGRGEAKPRAEQPAPALESEEADMTSPHSEIEEPRTANELIARYRDVRRRLYSPATALELADGKTRTDHVTCKAIHDPRALPRARTTAVSNPVSISNSGPRSPSSRLDPNARANRRHPRARSPAADRRRSSRGDLARPPGDRLVITAPRKVLQTGSYDRAPLGPRDGEAFGPRSRTARLHDRLVITADNGRSHSLNSSRFLFAPSSLSLRSQGERDGYR
jgi:hypothetical protein